MSHINCNSRFKLFRYRCASILFWGKKRSQYKTKFQRQKDLFGGAKKEKWYFFGLHVFTRFSLNDFDFYDIFGLPVAVKYCSLPEKRHSHASERVETSVSALSNSNSNSIIFSEKESEIYSLIRFWADQKKSQQVMSFDEQQFFNCLLSLGYVPDAVGVEEHKATKLFDPQIVKYNLLGFKSKFKLLQKQGENKNIAVFGVLPPELTGIANYNRMLFVNSQKYDVFCFDKEYIAFHSNVHNGENVYPYCLYNEFHNLYKQKIFVLGNSTHNSPYFKMAIAEIDKKNSWLYLHESRLIDFIFSYFHELNKNEELLDLLRSCYPDYFSDKILSQPMNRILDHALRNRVYGLRIIHKLTGMSNIIVNNNCAKVLLEKELRDCNITIKKAFLPISDLRGIQAYDFNDKSSVQYIGSFGVPSDQTKQTRKIVKVTTLLNNKYGQSVKLVLAGYGVSSYYQNLSSEEQACVIPFDSPCNDELFALMKRIRVGVQLRPAPHGESSGVICQLLGSGKRVITTEGFIDSDFGAYSKEVSPNVTDQELAEQILDSLKLGDYDNEALLRDYSFDVLKETIPRLLS